MKRIALLLAAGLIALTGCHRQHYQPDHDPGPKRVINGDSQAVQNWSNGDR